MTVIKKPRPAIMGEFDANSFTGNLWTRSSAVSLSMLSNSESHFDVIAFLNGYGSRSGHELDSLFDVSGIATLTSVTASFDSNDRFFLYSNRPLTFATHANGDNRSKFGFTGSESAVDQGNGFYKTTATNRWQRGVFEIERAASGKQGLFVKYISGTESFTGTDFRQVMSDGDVFLGFSSSEMSDAELATFSTGDQIEDTNGNTWEILSVTDGTTNMLELRPVSHSVALPNDNTIIRESSEQADILPISLRVQNLITLMRERGSENDADDIYSGKCLEHVDSSTNNIRWILEADGKVSINAPNGSTAYQSFGSLTTAGESLLKRLGFDGSETFESSVSVGIMRIKANNLAPCVLIADRGYSELRREVTGRDEFSMMADGSVVSSGLIPVKGWRMLIRVLGPAYGYTQDRERHLRNWWQHARRGLTIYPTFGDGDRVANGGNDTRRHVDKISIFGSTQHYNLTQTIEADAQESHHGKRVGGRLLVRRHPADAQARRESYSGDLDVFQDIAFRFLDDPSR